MDPILLEILWSRLISIANQGAAGVLIGLTNATAIAGTLVASTQLDPILRPRLLLVGAPLVVAVALVGVLLLPSLAVAWSSAIGLGLGILFPVLLALPLKLHHSVVDASAATSRMLGFGYILASLSPVMVGMSRDVLGTLDIGLVGLALVAGAVGLLAHGLIPRITSTVVPVRVRRL